MHRGTPGSPAGARTRRCRRIIRRSCGRTARRAVAAGGGFLTVVFIGHRVCTFREQLLHVPPPPSAGAQVAR
eukprot:5030825-Pyramimonas_sp.AAC.1